MIRPEATKTYSPVGDQTQAPEGTRELRDASFKSLCSEGFNKREPGRGIQGKKKKEMSQRCRPHVIFFNESKRGY